MSEPENRTDEVTGAAVPTTDTPDTTSLQTVEVPPVAPSTSASEDVVEVQDEPSTTPSADVELVSEPVTAPEPEPVAVTAATDSPTATETPIAEGVSTVAATTASVSAFIKKWLPKQTVIMILSALAGVVVVIALAYVLEQQGRINTGLFDGVERLMAAKKAVAKVNNAAITQRDLDISISQISAGVSLQGLDPEDPEIKSKITMQAVDMLVNTELLKQEAARREIVITDENIETRLSTLKEEVGGEEVLQERMTQFGIDNKTLRRDIKNELTIQTLLDQVFVERGVAVTDAEIDAFYADAGGLEAGLPPLEEVRTQIEDNLRTTKQQDVVTAYVKELRDQATVEILL